MFINKIGYEHILYGINNQDFGIELDNTKIVCDGCSEGRHSEVGAKLFCYLYKNSTENINKTANIFDKLTSIFSLVEDIKDYLLFTILFIYEHKDYFQTSTCGDGIIIKQDYNDILEYDIIDYQGLPPYFAYNFIDKKYLKKYSEGTIFKVQYFQKSDYKAIGIASDGLQYILNSYFKDEFEELLVKRKEVAIKRLINREHKYFKDDITIII
jgi:hypothetical protein